MSSDLLSDPPRGCPPPDKIRVPQEGVGGDESYFPKPKLYSSNRLAGSFRNNSMREVALTPLGSPLLLSLLCC